MNSDGLGRDAFLKPLVTQLQHEDRTKLQEDAQSISEVPSHVRLRPVAVIK
jgi:flagellar hook assembly protein FlgD